MSSCLDSDPSSRAESALADFIEACERGGSPDSSEFAARYAGVEADIAELIHEYLVTAARVSRLRRTRS